MTIWSVAKAIDGSFSLAQSTSGIVDVLIAGFATREAAHDWLKDYLLGCQYNRERAAADALLEVGVPEGVS